MSKVLIADDDPALTRLVSQYLSSEGFEVITASDGREALRLLERRKPDLLILDLMMPGADGFEVCLKARQSTDIPIIFLSARDAEEDRLEGLRLGADDYVTKPFSIRELAERVRACLRRYRGELTPKGEIIRAGSLEIRTGEHRVFRDREELSLTPTEFELLKALALAPGRGFSRMQLIEKVQGAVFDGYERTVDSHIRNLRRKIERDPANPELIVTVYGIGYRFGGKAR